MFIEKAIHSKTLSIKKDLLITENLRYNKARLVKSKKKRAKLDLMFL